MEIKLHVLYRIRFSKFILYSLDKKTVVRLSGIKSHITRAYAGNICYQLKFSKREAVKLFKRMYSEGCTCLKRKRLKITESLAIIEEIDNARVS